MSSKIYITNNTGKNLQANNNLDNPTMGVHLENGSGSAAYSLAGDKTYSIQVGLNDDGTVRVGVFTE